MSSESEITFSIIKRIAFCAGHRLLNHEGKCASLHGHNYVAEFHVTGDGVDDIGRIVDFSVIKHLFKSWLDDHWDHSVVLWQEDHEAIRALKALEPSRVYLLPWNPTAENMARYLLEHVGPELLRRISSQLVLTRVRVEETPDSSAEAALAAASRCGDEAGPPAWQQMYAG